MKQRKANYKNTLIQLNSKLPFAVSFSVLCIYTYIYIHIINIANSLLMSVNSKFLPILLTFKPSFYITGVKIRCVNDKPMSKEKKPDDLLMCPNITVFI